MQLVQQGKYEKALAAFEKTASRRAFEIVERCRMYINTCQRQLEKTGLAFPTPEEHYDYAVSQLNAGYFEEAREQFDSILDRPSSAPTTPFTGWRCSTRSPATRRIALTTCPRPSS